MLEFWGESKKAKTIENLKGFLWRTSLDEYKGSWRLASWEVLEAGLLGFDQHQNIRLVARIPAGESEAPPLALHWSKLIFGRKDLPINQVPNFPFSSSLKIVPPLCLSLPESLLLCCVKHSQWQWASGDGHIYSCHARVPHLFAAKLPGIRKPYYESFLCHCYVSQLSGRKKRSYIFRFNIDLLLFWDHHPYSESFLKLCCDTQSLHDRPPRLLPVPIFHLQTFDSSISFPILIRYFQVSYCIPLLWRVRGSIQTCIGSAFKNSFQCHFFFTAVETHKIFSPWPICWSSHHRKWPTGLQDVDAMM